MRQITISSTEENFPLYIEPVENKEMGQSNLKKDDLSYSQYNFLGSGHNSTWKNSVRARGNPDYGDFPLSISHRFILAPVQP
jgi:hypothetical protein